MHYRLPVFDSFSVNFYYCCCCYCCCLETREGSRAMMIVRRMTGVVAAVAVVGAEANGIFDLGLATKLVGAGMHCWIAGI
jgi:hypothetical protein